MVVGQLTNVTGYGRYQLRRGHAYGGQSFHLKFQLHETTPPLYVKEDLLLSVLLLLFDLGAGVEFDPA